MEQLLILGATGFLLLVVFTIAAIVTFCIVGITVGMVKGPLD